MLDGGNKMRLLIIQKNTINMKTTKTNNLEKRGKSFGIQNLNMASEFYVNVRQCMTSTHLIYHAYSFKCNW